jgi:hypothetical protein
VDLIPVATNHEDYNTHWLIAFGGKQNASEARASLAAKYPNAVYHNAHGPEPDRQLAKVALGLQTKAWSDMSTSIQHKVENGPPPEQAESESKAKVS